MKYTKITLLLKLFDFSSIKSKMMMPFILFVFSGCSLFAPTQKVELTPYAENLIQITQDIQYGLSQSQVVYLREYIDGPKIEELHDYGQKTRKMVRNIIAYSIDIVTLGHTDIKEDKKPEKLADYLDQLLRPLLVEKPESKLDFTIDELEIVLKNVGEQDKFLDALSAAQPLINNIASTMSTFIEDGNDVLDEALQEVYDQIMDDSEIFIEAERKLRDAQIHTMFNIQYLEKYRMGDQAALDTLLVKEPSLKEYIADRSKINSADLKAMEERFIFKLKALHDVREQLSVDIELYNNQMYELEKHSKMYKEALRQVRIVVIVWSEAHAKLAAGVTDPAKIDLIGLVVDAAKSILP